MRTFKLKIKEVRESFGYSLSELARRADISKAYLSQLESGKINDPSIFTMLRIAVVLNVPVEGLIANWSFEGKEIVQEIKVNKYSSL